MYFFWGSNAIHCLSSNFNSFSLCSKFQFVRKFRECRVSNPGRLGEKRERHLCAMPSPKRFHLIIVHCELQPEVPGIQGIAIKLVEFSAIDSFSTMATTTTTPMPKPTPSPTLQFRQKRNRCYKVHFQTVWKRN